MRKESLSYKEAEEAAFEDLTLPQMYSDAVLYKVVNSIEKKLKRKTAVTTREQEKYMEVIRRK
jgi:hypothetical protein